jgi:hypothetical protein
LTGKEIFKVSCPVLKNTMRIGKETIALMFDTDRVPLLELGIGIWLISQALALLHRAILEIEIFLPSLTFESKVKRSTKSQLECYFLF